MTESMIERVARILEPQAWDTTRDSLAYQNRRISSLRKARTVFEAILKPTDGMVANGSWAPNGCGEVGSTGAKNAYTKMIAYVLAEQVVG
ncbi:hypothetical protein BFN67_04810 [Pseudaminobacter manganicus]|uniref:Uncharacterized protein n=1 Tax=Manganibacter manganicus TaxID=1873176 RepID=A0A1V8RPP4_9HYPH|nr:hypothetical protein BFN67_04810 [Pseudaminobacter manganicus]